MPQTLPHNQIIADEVIPYESDWEYLADELKRLDVMIHLASLRLLPKEAVSFLDQLRGLVITDEEASQLLAGAAHNEGEPSQQRSLTQHLLEIEDVIKQRRAASLQQGAQLTLPLLSQLFGLTAFEEECVLICLAPELDRKYEKLYAWLQDDVTRKKPSVALALELLCHTMPEKLKARVVFDSRATLLRHRLIQIFEGSSDGPVPLLARFLKLDDRIVSFLLGFRLPDERLKAVATLISPRDGEQQLPIHTELKHRVEGFIREQLLTRHKLIFYLHGPQGAGKRALVETVCRELGLTLIVADGSRMQATAFEETVQLIGREALLQPALLCLEKLDALLNEPEKHQASIHTLLDACQTYSQVTFLLGTQPWPAGEIAPQALFVSLEVPQVPEESLSAVWTAQAAQTRARFADEVDFGAVAGKFRLSFTQIRGALAEAENLARWRSAEVPVITMADLHAACRAQATPRLEALARRIVPNYKWEDIILPEDQSTQLHELCQQARHRHIVYGAWGFARKLSRGRGLNALFSGPPGTGKTMAAEVIASELQLDLFQIDLSQVVSKYIGETEKNLHRIFQEAQSSNAILFFDEADALFGKRSEVKDAHDRYANIEVGYLLQKMEEYEGIAILATNMRHHLDEAFVRRLQFIVEFPFPDEERRRRIWQVSFPREAPLGDDVNFSLLAREVKLAGGNIKNISVAAAFYAASNGRVIGAGQLLQATRREFQKLGRTWSEPLTKGIGREHNAKVHG